MQYNWILRQLFFSVRCIFHSKVPITLLRTLCNPFSHGLRMPSEETAFTGWPKIHSHSKMFWYGRSIFCLPHLPKISDFFELCLHWVFIVRDPTHTWSKDQLKLYFLSSTKVRLRLLMVKSGLGFFWESASLSREELLLTFPAKSAFLTYVSALGSSNSERPCGI